MAVPGGPGGVADAETCSCKCQGAWALDPATKKCGRCGLAARDCGEGTRLDDAQCQCVAAAGAVALVQVDEGKARKEAQGLLLDGGADARASRRRLPVPRR